MANRRSPSDFGEIFHAADLPLIVGGQAVNLWAEVFRGVIPELEDFHPFLSVDADFAR